LNNLQKEPQKVPATSVVGAALINKNLRKSAVVTLLTKVILDEVVPNREHYCDMIRFNFFNSITSDKTYTKMQFSDLPPDFTKQVKRLYSFFEDCTTEEIFARLGTRSSTVNKYSPIQAKLAFTYYKKYKTLEYVEGNTIEDSEVLQKLTANEQLEYSKIY